MLFSEIVYCGAVLRNVKVLCERKIKNVFGKTVSASSNWRTLGSWLILRQKYLPVHMSRLKALMSKSRSPMFAAWKSSGWSNIESAILNAAQMFPDMTWCESCWLLLFLCRLNAVRKLLAASLQQKMKCQELNTWYWNFCLNSAKTWLPLLRGCNLAGDGPLNKIMALHLL